MAKVKARELVRSNVALTCHGLGIEKRIEEMFDYAEAQDKFEGPKNVLVLGGSAGYGLATRISLTAGCGAHTLSLSVPRFPDEKRPLGNPGFWGQNGFTKVANKRGYKVDNVFGNVFLDETRESVIKKIKEVFEGGKIDLLVYSIAAPRRFDPITNKEYSSSLKTLKGDYTGETIDVQKKTLNSITVTAANDQEIKDTVKVMGGEDWELWVKALVKAGVVTDKFKSITYTYLGSPMTDAIYRKGTIGKAKEHLEMTSKKLTKETGFECSIASGKAVVTQASVFIPTMPIYAAALMKVMKAKGNHEDTIEQMYRLYHDMVYGDKPEKDKDGFYRPDLWELEKDVQDEVKKLMNSVTPENFMEVVDGEEFIKSFHNINGFRINGIDYDAEFDPQALIDPQIAKEIKEC